MSRSPSRRSTSMSLRSEHPDARMLYSDSITANCHCVQSDRYCVQRCILYSAKVSPCSTRPIPQTMTATFLVWIDGQLQSRDSKVCLMSHQSRILSHGPTIPLAPSHPRMSTHQGVGSYGLQRGRGSAVFVACVTRRQLVEFPFKL